MAGANILFYTYPDHSSSPVLLTCTVRTRRDLYTALASSLRLPKMVHRPAPTNLDGLADLIKEARVTKVVCSDWQLSDDDTSAILAVFDDLGVTLVR